MENLRSFDNLGFATKRLNGPATKFYKSCAAENLVNDHDEMVDIC